MTTYRMPSHESRETAPAPRERFEVAVVGAGQAGLAIGYHLARQGRSFVILERADSVAAAWRERWDSLLLFTPRRYDGLPGLAFPGDADGEPTRDEVVAYLERYAATFELPVRTGSGVRSLARRDGAYLLETEAGAVTADQVVVATGPYQTPRLPELAGRLGPEVFQTHSSGYRRPGDLPAGTIVVVGGGNSGFQIAKELSASHSVHLAVGSRQTPLPTRLLGRHIFWWLSRLGLIERTIDSRLGRRMSQRDVLIGSGARQLRRRFAVRLEPRLVDASGRLLTFADGRSIEADAVIWATGYRLDHSWIELPLAGADGHLRQRRGVSDFEGLYFLGLPWQHTRGSALLGWVGADAAFIAGQVDALAAARAGAG